MTAQCAFNAQSSSVKCANYAHDMYVQQLHKADMDVDWFKARKKELGIKDPDIAAVLGVDRTVANKVINGKVALAAGKIDAMARLFQVTRDELMQRAGISDEEVRYIVEGARPSVALPHVSAVPGGNWQEAIERSRNTIMVAAEDAPKDGYALTVTGDSMDLHAVDGATIIIDPGDLDLFPGRLFVVMNEYGETTFKEFRDGPARLVPASSNPDHKEIPVTSTGWRVIGRVMLSVKRYV